MMTSTVAINKLRKIHSLKEPVSALSFNALLLCSCPKTNLFLLDFLLRNYEIEIVHVLL